ncbi:MAG: amine oxidase [Chitinophagaceae bacterium]
MYRQNPIKSFWMAGFECADHLNSFGNRVDLSAITGHLNMVSADYKNLEYFKIHTVREGIRWAIVEKSPYRYDWSSVAKLITAARENNIQQIWDLCHFGYPEDLTPLHPMFARRFASLCTAFVEFYRSLVPGGELIVTPINEVGFLSWLGGDVRGTSPYCVGQGWEVKYRLMKAYIEGVKALKAAEPGIRILTTEPLINVVPHEWASEEEIAMAASVNEDQHQVTEILSGRMCPELGGKEEYLDMLGYNYYYNNQWILGTNEALCWTYQTATPDYVPLHQLLAGVTKRYGKPIVITETSHPKEDRPLWLEMIAEECKTATNIGVELFGICWYPVLNRPDWDNLEDWHYSGVWDDIYNAYEPNRALHGPTATALLMAQNDLANWAGEIQKPKNFANSAQYSYSDTQT